jgi:hypothetical protein
MRRFSVPIRTYINSWQSRFKMQELTEPTCQFEKYRREMQSQARFGDLGLLPNVLPNNLLGLSQAGQLAHVNHFHHHQSN